MRNLINSSRFINCNSPAISLIEWPWVAQMRSDSVSILNLCLSLLATIRSRSCRVALYDFNRWWERISEMGMYPWSLKVNFSLTAPCLRRYESAFEMRTSLLASSGCGGMEKGKRRGNKGFQKMIHWMNTIFFLLMTQTVIQSIWSIYNKHTHTLHTQHLYIVTTIEFILHTSLLLYYFL